MKNFIGKDLSLEQKKEVRSHIAPLQPSTLAAFLPWGISKGAGRMTLTSHKGKLISEKYKFFNKKMKAIFKMAGKEYSKSLKFNKY